MKKKGRGKDSGGEPAEGLGLDAFGEEAVAPDSGADEDEDFEDGRGAAEPPPAFSFVAGQEEKGLRLDVALSRRFPEFSRARLARLAKEGRVLADGRPLKAGALLSPGQRVELPRPEGRPTALEPDPGVALDIIYEDEGLLVLNKPWGLSCHPGAGPPEPTLAAGLLAHRPQLDGVGELLRPGLVHRLDKDTSGLLAVGKSETALRLLSEAFSRREVQKVYLALVKGMLPASGGLIDSPIGRHPTQRHKMAAGQANGRPARTIYRVLRRFPKSGVSLVRLNILTGRTHQIRVHLASLGAPVLGDAVYSRGPGELLERHPALKTLLQRQMLHARRLAFTHPGKSELKLTFWAPWPDDFLALFRALLALERIG